MAFKAIPRQRPHCSLSDFATFLKMLMSGSLLKGKYIKEFESDFAKIYGQKYVLSVGSCRSAFSLIIDALGIVKNDEVILPAFNLPAFPKILKFKGIKPVFVDIDCETLNIDVEQIEKNITPKTKAIVVVHLFGNVCDMEKIVSIAKKYNLPIIEDCANSFMAQYQGSYVGTYGNIACFSLGHSKDVPTFGGGIVITNNDELYSNMRHIYEREFTLPSAGKIIKAVIKGAVFKVATLRIIFLLFVYPFIWFFALFGFDLPGYFIEEKDKMITGIHKKRFTNFQAYIGLNWLKNDNDMQQKRIDYAQILNTALSDFDGISVSKVVEGGTHVYWNYIILAENRAAILKELLNHGIDGKKINAFDCPRFNIFKEFKRDCPVSNRISGMIFALPIYHYLKEEDVRFMTKTLLAADGK